MELHFQNYHSTEVQRDIWFLKYATQGFQPSSIRWNNTEPTTDVLVELMLVLIIHHHILCCLCFR